MIRVSPVLFRDVRAAAAAALSDADAALRAEGRHAPEQHRLPWLSLGVLVVVGGALFGATMGSLAGVGAGTLHSAVKVPVVLVLTTVLSVPFFYVLNRVLGLAGDFGPALRGVLAAQATLALALAGFAPLVAFAFLSRVAYPTALFLCFAAWAAASLAGQVTLARHYRPLVARRPRHRIALRTWGVLYVFVAIKLSWILRPLVGDPRLPRVFLRGSALDENPYLMILWTVLGLAKAIALKLA